MDAENLLKNVDPSIEANEIIDQILLYSSKIKTEIGELRAKNKEETELSSKIKTKKKELEGLRKPKSRVSKSQTVRDPEAFPKLGKSAAQPVLDYRSVIKKLENEIFYINQRYNDTKANNEHLMRELDELRKSVMISKGKYRSLKDKLKKKEKEFREHEESIRNYKESVFLSRQSGSRNERNSKETGRFEVKEQGNSGENQANRQRHD